MVSYNRKDPGDNESVLSFLKRNVRSGVFGSLIALGVLGGCQSLYTIPADSQGVVRRFGA